ncbi:hypothetical protein HK411_12545, partial [Calidifontibacter sp. DB2511S]|nr:hypothetical protein [Calidifontibacter sp. DB2511S]
MFEARDNTPTSGPDPAAGADSARSNNTNNASDIHAGHVGDPVSATTPAAMSDGAADVVSEATSAPTSAPAAAAAPTCDGALSAPTAAELRALIERLAALDETSLSMACAAAASPTGAGRPDDGCHAGDDTDATTATAADAVAGAADPADPGAAADSGAPDLTGAVLVEAITVLE